MALQALLVLHTLQLIPCHPSLHSQYLPSLGSRSLPSASDPQTKRRCQWYGTYEADGNSALQDIVAYQAQSSPPSQIQEDRNISHYTDRKMQTAYTERQEEGS